MSEIALRSANPNIVQGVGNAIQQLYKGNYAAAGRAAVDAALDSYPPTRYLKMANELINYSVISYYVSQQEEIFAHFQKTGKSVDSESDRSIAMTVQFQSLLRKLQGDVINSYCKLNNIPRSSLSQSEINRLHSEAEHDLRETIRERVTNEAKIKQQQEEYLDVIRHFKEDFLLDGFSYGTSIDLRLSRLFNWRDKIVAMVGGPLVSEKYKSDSPEENLRYALKNYIALVMDVGNTKMIPGGELAFHDWLIEEGFLKVEVPKLAECFGAYTGSLQENNYQSKMNAENNYKWELVLTGTKTATASITILEKSQGRMELILPGAAEIFTGSIELQGEIAAFEGSYYEVFLGIIYEGECSGVIKKVNNQYYMTGTAVDWGTSIKDDRIEFRNEFTFNNLVKEL
jgi:hypothetical protein